MMLAVDFADTVPRVFMDFNLTTDDVEFISTNSQFGVRYDLHYGDLPT